MTNQCKGVFGFLFGHKINDVYDEESLIPDHVDMVKLANTSACLSHPYSERFIAEARHRKSTYVRSYCERCGQQITREESGHYVN